MTRTTASLASLRYLTFEISDTCALAQLHPRCPVSDPDRFRYGHRDRVLDDDTVLAFWAWARARGFHGVVLWHQYNEPAAVLPRIRALMERMRREVPGQQTHLWTALVSAAQASGFDHVVHTDYRVVAPGDLDNRRASVGIQGDYAQAPREGVCGRARAFELIVDNRGNWLKCCNDWQCEESYGNLYADAWDALLARHLAAPPVAWHDAASFAALPRLCRGCLTANPSLHRTAVPPPGRTSW